MILESFGHEIHIAHSGEDALKIAARCRPEIGILDIGMPDLKRLRSRQEDSSRSLGEAD
jgi:DNA-binding response OmpR family regulator